MIKNILTMNSAIFRQENIDQFSEAKIFLQNMGFFKLVDFSAITNPRIQGKTLVVY